MSFLRNTLTDVLSEYLEFDPAQLQLGVWSGDLSMTDVSLKQNAINPLLADAALLYGGPPSPDGRPSLQVKLLKSDIGQFRLQIPWKRLMLGHATVRLLVSDVTIVLGLDATVPDEKAPAVLPAEQIQTETVSEEKNDDEEEEEGGLTTLYRKKLAREDKRKRVAEAERLHLQGLSISSSVYAAGGDGETDAGEEKANETEDEGKSKSKRPGALDRWIQSVADNFLWRFFVGLQTTVRNVRVVVVQSGVEVGVIVHSMEAGADVCAPKDKDATTTTPAGDPTLVNAKARRRGTVLPTATNMNAITADSSFESASETVDSHNAEREDGSGDRFASKQLKICGLGGFIRRESVSRKPVPRELYFSTSVTADDYILRPSEVDFHLSVFKPGPDDGKSKKKKTNPKKEEEVSTVETVASTASSRARRGKRDKHTGDSSTKTEPSVTDDDDKSTSAAAGDPVKKRHERVSSNLTTGSTATGTRPLLMTDDTSTVASLTHQSITASKSPHVETKLFFGDVKTVCSSRHFHLANVFMSSVARMLNGRPDKTISSVLMGEDTVAVTRSVTVDAPTSLTIDIAEHYLNLNMTPMMTTPSPGTGTPSSGSGPPLLRRNHTVDGSGRNMPPLRQPHQQLKLQLLQPVNVCSERSEVVRAWWQYAYNAVVWELRERKRQRNKFRPTYLDFDWNRQKRLRREYVDLYISVRLEQRAFGEKLRHASTVLFGEEELLTMEDELSIEQILLYRSIARALRVRGLTTMPDSILDLQRTSSSGSTPSPPSTTTRKAAPRSSLTKKRKYAGRPSMSADMGLLRRQRSSMSTGEVAIGGNRPSEKVTFVQEHDDSLLSPIRRRADAARKRRRHEDDESSINLTVDTPSSPLHKSPPPVEAEKSPERTEPEITPVHRNIRFASFDVSSPIAAKGSDKARGITTKSNDPVGAPTDYSQVAVDNRSFGDARTVRTFTTAKTTKSKRSSAASEQELSLSKVTLFSTSFQFKSIELMVYEEERGFGLRASRKTSRSNYPAPGGQSGDESLDDDVSELSVLSSDFNDEDYDPLDASDEEAEDAAASMMFSTDFLLFGMPSSIFRMVVSKVSFAARGQSGGSNNASLSVGQIEIEGDESCHLLSLGSGDGVESGSAPGEELSLDGQFQEARPHERAVTASVVHLDDQRHVQCDISLLTAKVEMHAMMKLSDFCSTSVRYPQSVFQSSGHDKVRKYLLDSSGGSSGNWSNAAIRIHGFDAIVPCRPKEENATEEMHIRPEEDADVNRLSDNKPNVRLSIRFIEFYSGSLVRDLCMASFEEGDETRTQAYFSAAGSHPAPLSRPGDGASCRRLRMLDVERILSNERSISSQHGIMAFSGIDCLLESGPIFSGLVPNDVASVLEAPVDLELMLSCPYCPDLDGACPDQELVVQASPMLFLLSERRLDILSECVSALSLNDSTSQRSAVSTRDDSSISLPPRVEVLSNHVLNSFDASFSRIQLSIVSDSAENGAHSFAVKEIILEESITDVLWLLSCFDLKFPVEESVSCAMQICVDRLSVLGFTAQEAQDCVEAARLNFLADVEIMKKAQAQALAKLSDLREETEGGGTRNPVSRSDIAMNPDGDDNSMSDDVDEASEGHSEESIDIIETTIRNAVERTMRSFLPLLVGKHSDGHPRREFVVVDLQEGAHVSVMELFYDFHIKVDACSLVVRNGTGIHLLRVGPRNSSSYRTARSVEEKSVHASADEVPSSGTSRSRPEQNGDNGQFGPVLVSPGRSCSDEFGRRHGISFSTFEMDRGCEFGGGGQSLAVLGLDELSGEVGNERKRERLYDVFIGEMELLFSQKLASELIEVFSSFADIVARQQPEPPREAPQTKLTDSEVVSSTFYGHADCMSLLLASDELAPFSQFVFRGVAVEKESDQDDDGISSKLNFTSHQFSLLNLTPEGQTYPEVVSPLPKESVQKEDTTTFSMQLLASADSWKKGSELSLTLSSVRVCVLRQYINELLQYVVSKEHGIGLLLNTLPMGDPVTDVNGNPPHPLHYSISLLDSSLIIPRSSTSSELLAVEAGSVIIENSYMTTSWSLPTDTTPLLRGTEGASSSPEKSPMFSNDLSRDQSSAVMNEEGRLPGSWHSSLSETEFHDALDLIGDASPSMRMNLDESATSRVVSSFDKQWLARVTVRAQNMRLYTALAVDLSDVDAENPRFNVFYGIDGRAEAYKPVFTRRPSCVSLLSSADVDEHLSKKAMLEKRGRTWEEISTHPVSLEVIADYVPHLRLLLADAVSESEHGDDDSTPFSFGLDMHMSQFYLLLSVWFANMQELPVMFPFSEAQIQEGARSPPPPPDFPEYGTVPYVSWLKDLSAVRSEIACLFNELVVRCSFDEPGYFDEDPKTLPMMSQQATTGSAALRVVTQDCVVHMASDRHGILRLGCGASTFELIDERKADPFSDFLSVHRQGSPENDDSEELNYPMASSWADLAWGLDCDGQTFRRGLPQPFQASVFMTPGWCLINLGVERLNAVMFDFSPIWIVLEYFVGYFSNPMYGYPVFEAIERLEKLKSSRRKAVDGQFGDADNDEEDPGLKMDFRLWVLNPELCVPSNAEDAVAPCLRIESNTGFWFRYNSMGPFSSQEMASTDLALSVAEEFRPPALCRQLDGIAGSGTGVKTLFEGLSFGVRYDMDSRSKYTDLSVQIPFSESTIHDLSTVCSVTAPEIEVKPIIITPPTVCTPLVRPTRYIGSTICEITLILELLPLTSSLLLNLVTGPGDASRKNEQHADSSNSDSLEVHCDSDLRDKPADAASFSACAQIGGLRLFVIDPVLGKHLPVAVVSISSIRLTASQLSEPTDNGATGDIPSFLREAPMEDLQVVVNSHLWADYFKLGITRSWEPLLEPYECLLLYETSTNRGQGLSLNSDSSFHVNVTGALLVTLDETISTLKRSIAETFENTSTERDSTDSGRSENFGRSSSRTRLTGVAVEEIQSRHGYCTTVVHQIPKPLQKDERVAFSFRNLTGQRIRIHQQSELARKSGRSKAVITYLDHTESAKMQFNATMSVFHNLEVVEVPFPGLPNSFEDNNATSSPRHAIDVQIPGFRWLQGISVDTSGRKFEDMVPRSQIVRSKLKGDWRLDNALKLLSEVGLENGGRLVTARSLFEIINNTSHSISLMLNPDPRHQPIVQTEIEHRTDSASDKEKVMDVAASHWLGENCFERIEPGDACQIPTLLLESALQLDGSHLGCVWLRPDEDGECSNLLDSFLHGNIISPSKSVVGFCSRPIQIAKLVHESAVIFGSAYGEDLASNRVRSGIQVSCPVSEGDEGVSIAPFCYVVEIRRSPLVRNNRERYDGDKDHAPEVPVRRDSSSEKKSRSRHKDAPAHLIHGPVAYSLSIHPPLVIENLLPEGGRFELMHATRRSVLWFADLKPGERVPVHSVGLDAPLLLLINLGFCRTPVGEGVLVHHGTGFSHAKGGPGSPANAGLKSLGKAVTKGKKQIGKTLATISDSPDRRGKGRLFMVQNPEVMSQKAARSIKLRKSVAASGDPLGLDTGFNSGNGAKGKVHTIESQVFTPDDVESEILVVDGIGQRLTLGIKNIRGGGGQRRISLFCPFWIVNTTEHSLRYKQEKSSSYVAGTVISPTEDGSKPVDGSSRNYVNHYKQLTTFHHIPSIDRRTIFAGTPGALATATGQCDLNPEKLGILLEKDLPLDMLVKMAFMFNFHEDVLSMRHQKLCVQLGDAWTQYASDWSTGFSLDSVGVTQIVAMHCKEGRALEVSVTISVAPGILSGYTKVVRFSPRYVLVNQLERPIRLWQDSSLSATGVGNSIRYPMKWRFGKTDSSEKINQYESLFGRPVVVDDMHVEGLPVGTTADESAVYIASIGSSKLVPFHLPDTRGERQLRIGLGFPWTLSSSISADITGEYTLQIMRALDLRLLRHVSTRLSPQYAVVLPPPDENEEEPWDGELGVWFETDWGGDRSIIVKGTKRGRYSFNHTDIHVGDQLLYIDGREVSDMSFSETMALLKERLARVSLSRRQDTSSSDRSGPLSRSRRLSRRSLRIVRSSKNMEFSSERVVLTFRTLEERLRRVRVKAASTEQNTLERQKAAQRLEASDLTALSAPDISTRDTGEDGPVDSIPESERESNICVDVRILHNSVFVCVRPPDPDNPPFRIENRAMEHMIYFRQRGCVLHPWNSLKPGESRAYTWEEPMRPKKLDVRVGRNNVTLFGKKDVDASDIDSRGGEDGDNKAVRSARVIQLLSFQNVDNEELSGFGATKSVKLEEIGFADFIPCPGETDGPGNLLMDEKYLHLQVDTDGATRVLIISDMMMANGVGEEQHTVLEEHLSTLTRVINEERKKLACLENLKITARSAEAHPGLTRTLRSTTSLTFEEEKEELVPPSESTYDEEVDGSKSNETSTESNCEPTDVSMIEDQARELADLPEDSAITRCNQVAVQILEATGLSPLDLSGLCSPYCEISVKRRSKRNRAFMTKTITKKTYYIEKTLAPKWSDQSFVFDVPTEAVNVTRGHFIRLRIRNFRRVGQDPVIGQTTVHLRSLRNQKELEGWYPLTGRTGQRELEDSAKRGRGSVKLRVQWIYTVPALVDYFILMSERRLWELQQSRLGMHHQLESAIESDKRKKTFKDPFSIVKVPKLLGLKHTAVKEVQQKALIAKDGLGRVEDRAPHRAAWKLPHRRQSFLRKSNNMYLLMLHSETAESKRKRRLGIDTAGQEVCTSSNATEIARERLESISELGDIGEIAHIASHANTDALSESGLPSEASELANAPISPRLRLKYRSRRLSSGSIDSSEEMVRFHRARAASLPDVRVDNEDTVEATSVSPRTRSLSRGDVFIDVQNGLSGLPLDIQVGSGDLDHLIASDSEDEERRLGTIDQLFEEGLVFHKGGSYLQSRHLTHHFRQSLVAESVSDNSSPSRGFQPKSSLRVPWTIQDFKSWTAAQAVLNDEELCAALAKEMTNRNFGSGGRVDEASPGQVHLTELEVEGNDRPLPDKLKIPPFAPPAMFSRALSRAENIIASRNQFEKACTRSLKSVLNPGGLLTIRPITVLNLPDMYTRMTVKVRYGSEVLSSQTADAKVTPRWASDVDAFAPTSASHQSGSENSPTTSESFKFDENDLPVYVEPLQTSGSLLLSVVGERLNTSKIEVGVLRIPLGAAISCCIEAMEDYFEAKNVPNSPNSEAPSAPMYVRWFPLMSPEDSVPVAGDMGLSARPKESEKLRDNMFSQYFAPCIKLALIWQPDNPRADPENYASHLYEEGVEPADNVNANISFQHQSPISAPTTQTYFNADVGRISAALIDSLRAKELASACAMDIDVRYSVTMSKRRTSVAVGWIQIDHQEPNAREPVVLAPTPVAHPQPTLQFLAVKDNLRSKSNIDTYEYIAAALQEMDLTVEESWLFDVWEFLISVVRRREIAKKVLGGSEASERKPFALASNEFLDKKGGRTTPTIGLLALLNQETSGSSGKMYVEQLVLGFVKVNLTYLKGGSKGSWELTERGGWTVKHSSGSMMPEVAFDLNLAAGSLVVARAELTNDISEVFLRWSEHTHEEELWTEVGGSGRVSQNLPNTIAAVFPAVSETPVRLQGKVIEHVFESPGEILESIKNYYVNETLKQIYKIIGSLDFVGNPTMLLNSFVTGVRDFIMAPSKEFLRNPQKPSRVGIGVAKGTLSLLSNSTSGLSGFAAKISAMAGQGVAVLSLDDEYKQWHQDVVVTPARNLNRTWKQRGLESSSVIITRPLQDIALGVLTGVVGIAYSPYEGARKGGGKGFAMGVVRGTVGVIVKPLVGIFDAFSHCTGSLHDIARSVNVLEKRYNPSRIVRLRYIFGMEKVLIPFDIVAARSVSLLKLYPAKVKRGTSVSALKTKLQDAYREVHVASEVLLMEPGVETYVVATTHRIVLFKVKRDSGGTLAPKICWEVDLRGGAKVSSSVQDEGHNGVALTITTREQKAKHVVVSPPPKSKDAVPDSVSQTSVTDVEEIEAPVLGTDQSNEWRDLAPKTESADDALTGEISEPQLHGSGLGNQGVVLEWFRVLAEFQHRRQLTRIHNAVCCITGDFDGVIYERRLGPEGSREGYTSFGEMVFGSDIAQAKKADNLNDVNMFYDNLDNVPWLQVSEFQRNIGRTRRQQRMRIATARKSWLLSDELRASAEEDGPTWLVEARARAMFVAPEAPPLPSFLDPEDDVVYHISAQLEKGNISYEQAQQLIHTHAKAVLAEDTSTDSLLLQGLRSPGDSSSEDLFESAKLLESGKLLEYWGVPSQRPLLDNSSEMGPTRLLPWVPEDESDTAGARSKSLFSSGTYDAPAESRTLLDDTQETEAVDLFGKPGDGTGSRPTPYKKHYRSLSLDVFESAMLSEETSLGDSPELGLTIFSESPEDSPDTPRTGSIAEAPMSPVSHELVTPHKSAPDDSEVSSNADDNVSSKSSITDESIGAQHRPSVLKEQGMRPQPSSGASPAHVLSGRETQGGDAEDSRLAPGRSPMVRSNLPQKMDGQTQDPVLNSRLERVEMMLEQLVLNTSAQAVTPQPGRRLAGTPSTGVGSPMSTQQDVETLAMKRELAELRNQIVEQRNFYQEAIATAALRQEVADLRREAAGVAGHRSEEDANTMEALRREVEQVKTQLAVAGQPPAAAADPEAINRENEGPETSTNLAHNVVAMQTPQRKIPAERTSSLRRLSFSDPSRKKTPERRISFSDPIDTKTDPERVRDDKAEL